MFSKIFNIFGLIIFLILILIGGGGADGYANAFILLFVLGFLGIKALLAFFSWIIFDESEQPQGKKKDGIFVVKYLFALGAMFIVLANPPYRGPDSWGPDEKEFFGALFAGVVGFLIPNILLHIFRSLKGSKELRRTTLIAFIIISAIYLVREYNDFTKKTPYQESIDKVLDGAFELKKGSSECATNFKNYAVNELVINPALPQNVYDKIIYHIEKGDNPALFQLIMMNDKTRAKEIAFLNDIYKQKYINNCGKEILEAILLSPYTPISTVEEYLLNDDKYINHSYVLKLLFVIDRLVNMDFYHDKSNDFYDTHFLNIKDTCAKIKLAEKNASKRLPSGFAVTFNPKERFEAAKNGPCKEFWEGKKT